MHTALGGAGGTLLSSPADGAFWGPYGLLSYRGETLGWMLQTEALRLERSAPWQTIDVRACGGDSEPERTAALLGGLEAADVAFATLIAMDVAVEHGRHGESGLPDEQRPVADLGTVQQSEILSANRISAAAADGSLWSSRRLHHVLVAWAHLTSAHHVRQAVARRISDDRTLMDLLALVVPPPRTRGEGRMRVSTLETCFDLESVASRAEVLARQSTWTTAELDAARYVVAAQAAKAAGRLGPFGEF